MSQQRFNEELTPDVREKMRKNLVYVGIFSVIMLFAGFASGYIVSAGDTFWVKYNFPTAFYISTVIIILSSIVLAVGIKAAQKNNNPHILKKIVPLTFLLGVGFAYFQFKGYSELYENGAYLTSKIVVTEGRYGSYYELKVDGKYMEVDGNEYLIGGETISEDLKKEIGLFAKQFENISEKPNTPIKDYGRFTLVYKNQEVSYRDQKFFIQDTVELTHVDLIRLKEFSWHLRDGRGDFFHKGTFGKDFKIYYKGKELVYKNRDLYHEGVKLNAALQLKMNTSSDTATSYLYIITFLHLLHVLVTLIVLFRSAIRSFSGKLSADNYLPIRTLGIFWHFLGTLWVFLLLFLLFIH